MGQTEDRIKALGIELPKKDEKVSKIESLQQVDDLIFMSGHGCEKEGGEPIHRGKVGDTLSVEQGYEAARQSGLQILTTLKMHLGTLDRVKRIVKVLGFVNSSADFYRQPEVMNGFTDLMIEVLGDRGKHARSAIGTSVLPNNQAVEIELILQVTD